jgi:putative ribosome biogenesis GTPase RsgA
MSIEDQNNSSHRDDKAIVEQHMIFEGQTGWWKSTLIYIILTLSGCRVSRISLTKLYLCM